VWLADLLPHEMAPQVAAMMDQGLRPFRTLQVDNPEEAAMILDSAAELPQPVPVPPASIADPPADERRTDRRRLTGAV
jgi:hypothetical protein